MEQVHFVALDDIRQIHPDGRVLITTKEDLKNYGYQPPENVSILEVSEDEHPDQILLRTFQNIWNMQSCRTITIAIDPGTTMTGIAVFLDDVFIYSREVFSLQQLQQFIKSTFLSFPTRKKMIKIGNGLKFLTNQFLDYLPHHLSLIPEIYYMIVNESSTTKRPYRGRHKFLSKHEKAAMFIGRRHGELISLDSCM